MKDLTLLYGEEDKNAKTILDAAEQEEGEALRKALGGHLQFLDHSETAFLSDILRKRERQLMRQPPSIIVLHIVSTRPSCPECTHVLKRLLPNEELKTRITEQAGSNLHIVYAYLQQTRASRNPFKKVAGKLSFTAGNPQFLGIDCSLPSAPR